MCRVPVHAWSSCGCPCRDYRKCYQLIVDVAHTLPDHLLEFKVVGGLCSFKVSWPGTHGWRWWYTHTTLHSVLCQICQILFRAGEVENAFLQFRRHTEAFRSQVGPKHLAYEHMSWMAKQ